MYYMEINVIAYLFGEYKWENLAIQITIMVSTDRKIWFVINV